MVLLATLPAEYLSDLHSSVGHLLLFVISATVVLSSGSTREFPVHASPAAGGHSSVYLCTRCMGTLLVRASPAHCNGLLHLMGRLEGAAWLLRECEDGCVHLCLHSLLLLQVQ